MEILAENLVNNTSFQSKVVNAIPFVRICLHVGMSVSRILTRLGCIFCHGSYIACVHGTYKNIHLLHLSQFPKSPLQGRIYSLP